jgi:hypothetical protein
LTSSLDFGTDDLHQALVVAVDNKVAGSAESGGCATMGMFHLDLRAAVAVAAVEFSIPYLYITNAVIVPATLMGRGNVRTLGVGAGP